MHRVAERRKTNVLLHFIRWFGKESSADLEFICSDMWKPYLKVAAKKASQAIHILDRFHIVAHLNKAIDQVRAAEAKTLVQQGYEPVLKNTHGLLLKRPQNLTAALHTSWWPKARWDDAQLWVRPNRLLFAGSPVTIAPLEAQYAGELA